MNPLHVIFSAQNLQHILIPARLLAAAGIVGIFSLVYKENKLFRFFEHLFLGLAAGYTVQTNWTDILRPQWWDPMVKDGQWYWVVIAPISLMFYGIYTRNFAWQARLLFGLIFGMVTGTVFQAFASQYAPQVSASFKPIIPSATTSPAVALDNIIFLAVIVCVSSYFFFAFEQNSSAMRSVTKAGRWFLMIAFGAIFGSTIMTREALLIDRIYFILHDWLNIVR